MEKQALFDAFDAARPRLQTLLGKKRTPLKKLVFLEQPTYDTYIKEETETEVHSFKIRGAYNAAAALKEANPELKEIVASSAGNHAQGVALSAKKLDLHATIFMPASTPETKVYAVKQLGGNNVSIQLTGDNYDETSRAAKNYLQKSDGAFVHPFDDLNTIAGQATIADEIIAQSNGKNPFDYAFIQIGGGGLAAGVAACLKQEWPDIKIIGVEGEGQASMKASIEADEVVELETVNTFCDGTAVRRPGDTTFEICREYLDDIITVSNDEICAAWDEVYRVARATTEPSGVMGYAGSKRFSHQNPDLIEGKKVLTILSGGNVDPLKIAEMAKRAAVGAHEKQLYRITLDEDSGRLLEVLDELMDDIGVTDFLYGKNSLETAHPVIGFGASPERLIELENRFKEQGINFQNVTNDIDVKKNNIPYSPELIKDSHLFDIRFSEKSGALRNLLRSIKDFADLTYFNYSYTGETTGQAIIGFDTDDGDALLREARLNTQSVTPLSERVSANIKNIPISEPNPL